MVKSSRRRLLIGSGVALVSALGAGGYFVKHPWPAPIGFKVTSEELMRARALLARHPSIDAHAHPGRTFVEGAEHLSGLVWVYAKLGTFEKRTIADMSAGGLTAAAFAAVSDFQALGTAGEGPAAVRNFEPGEAWASYKRQIGNIKALAAAGLVYPVRSLSDFAAARAAGKVGAILTVEGGDFLEGRAERVAQAWADGVRSITLMHYRNNELGDIITAKPVHGKLSDAGVAVVRAMNAAGMLIDVAHASEATAMGAIHASARPVIASHVHVQSEKLQHPRFISLELAKAVAQAGGGVLGAWPAGIGIVDLNGFVDRVFELVDYVGIDHVCLGTDMDANYKPVFDTYANLPVFVAGLLKRGMHEPEVAKVIGGNFLRVFAAVQVAVN
ncbi:MAG: membrane dipeptidase [Polaromonas sp.]|nr:membrane dipeptidase [Polaromonas sp.]